MKDRYQVIVADPPYKFSDRLQMSDVKRGAASNYATMTIAEIKALPIKDIVDPEGCVLALWVPSSLLVNGVEIMQAWGFTVKSTYVWVKNKKEPFKDLLKLVNKSLEEEEILTKKNIKNAITRIGETCKDQLNQMLQFGMGHLFRQTHEIALIGINNGGIYSKLQNRSQRSVSFATNLKHSMKPDTLHQSLEIMFPDTKKIELFSRRVRNGWTTLGNQCEDTMGEDINKSLTDLIYQ